LATQYISQLAIDIFHLLKEKKNEYKQMELEFAYPVTFPVVHWQMFSKNPKHR